MHTQVIKKGAVGREISRSVRVFLVLVIAGLLFFAFFPKCDLLHLSFQDSVLAEEECKADLYIDGKVDGRDLEIFSGWFGKEGCSGDCQGDFDDNGVVDGLDLAQLAGEFNREDCPMPMVSVPDVMGLSLSEAEATIEQEGFVVGTVSHVYSTEVHAGDVIGQTPLAGTMAPYHSGIALVVSSGPPPEDPMPDGSFAGTHEDSIPQDADPNAYDIKRFAMVTGGATETNGSPLEGVRVSVLNHTEYGSTLTGADGRFKIPVQGGATYTIKYEISGYCPAQRKVEVPWNDFVLAPDVAMTPQDTKTTTITFDGNPDTPLVHVGTTTNDSSGTREAVVVFSGDTEATAVNPDGTTTPLTGPLTVRATEFTTPESMPAMLPPTSAFTYCVELTINEAEGAERVEFSKPVAFFVRNFLGFDVGTRVPVGYYDREEGVWKGSKDGLVVKLLDTNGDGAIDALDADGDDLPDDLDEDGSHGDEVFGLEASGKYDPGDTVWRIEVTHFSVIDGNFPTLVPGDSTPPNPEGKPSPDTPQPDNPCKASIGSSIAPRDRILHDHIPLPGMDFDLYYASDRIEDFPYRLIVPASGGTVPDSLKRILVELEVAGRKFTRELPASPNQQAEFIWDNRDVDGNMVMNSIHAKVRIGFVYDVFYSGVPDDVIDDYKILSSWALPGGRITAVPGRAEQVFWKEYDMPVWVLAAGISRSGLGSGWTIGPHHGLITGVSPVLVRGDGTQRRVHGGQDLVWTVAGNGSAGFSGDGGPATQAQLYLPNDVAVGPDGTLYISDLGNCRIRKVGPDGNITTIAGTGGHSLGNFNEGGRAIETDLNALRAIDVGPDGLVYLLVSGPNGDVVRRIDRDGNITTVVGLNGDPGANCYVNGTASPGDGGPANDARLCDVQDILVGPDGSIYIAQGREYGSDNVIRKVGPDGIIYTIAGKGPEAGGNTETDSGMAALEARFAVPSGLSLDRNGNLLIADFGNHCIRSLGIDGIIRTVGGKCSTVGVGTWCYGEDGDNATDCWYWYAEDVLAAPDGTFYALCNNFQYANHIRRIDPNGILHSFAGRFEANWTGYEGDSGPAVDAKFSSSGGHMAMDHTGSIYLADYANHVIRKIGPLFTTDYPGLDEDEILVPECAECPDYGGMGYVFDQGGKHLRTIDLKTGKVLYRFFYDANDLLVGIQDRFNRTTTIQRDGTGRAVSITGPYGDVVQLSINGSGNLEEVTYEDGTAWSFGYSGHLLTSKVDPRGKSFSYNFDSNGRFLSNTDAAGGGITLSRTEEINGTTINTMTTAENRVSSYKDWIDKADRFHSLITGKDGTTAEYEESANKLLFSRTEPFGIVFTGEKGIDPFTNTPYTSLFEIETPGGLSFRKEMAISYGPDADNDHLPDTITETRSLNNKVYTTVRNIPSHTTTVTTPEGRVTTTEYDPDTLLVTRRRITGIADTEYQYTSDGRLNRLIQGDRSYSFTYSGAYLSSVTNSLNQVTQYNRDIFGRISAITQADGSIWVFGRDEAGNIISVTEPDSTTTHSLSYTPVGLLESYTSPLNAKEEFFYDKDKLLTRHLYPSGRAVVYDYNEKGQLTEEQTQEGIHSFSYDASTGLLLQAVSRDGQQQDFTYDGSLLKSVSWSGVVSGTVTYGYNNDLRTSSMSYGDASLTLTRDDDGLLTGVGNITLGRDSGNGLLTSITDGDFSIAYTRNTYGEIESVTVKHGANALYSVNTTYDKLGRISTRIETIGGTTHTWSYAYDAIGQLTQVKRDDVVVEAYTYNLAGDRASAVNTLTGTNLNPGDISYDIEHKLLTAGTTTYSYDADGRLHQVTNSSGTTTYHYNTDGTLAQVDFADGRTITYLYDHKGRRVTRAVDGVRTHAWLYGKGLMPVAEYDGSGVLQKTFIYAGGPVPVAYIQGGATYHIITDYIGSPRLIVDSTGAIVKRIDYDSFGNVISDSNPGLYLCFGFAGGMTDPDHELIRFGARDYQPSTGRWTAKDPILFKGGFNLYGYVRNDPVNLVDRHGQKAFTDEDQADLVAQTAGVAGYKPLPLPPVEQVPNIQPTAGKSSPSLNYLSCDSSGEDNNGDEEYDELNETSGPQG